jgi:molybdopterin adenylyltransferase
MDDRQCPSFSLTVLRGLAKGETALLTDGTGTSPAGCIPAIAGQAHLNRAGTLLCAAPEEPLIRVLGHGWLPGGENRSLPCTWVQAVTALGSGPLDVLPVRRGISLAWITLSDKGSRGERVDRSGPQIEQLAGEHLRLSLSRGYLLPDSIEQLRCLLTDLALLQGFDLILTSGGTGLGPRDITPEATGMVLDKGLPGFERVMTAASLEKTPHGMISRARAGVLGQSIVVNLPGSPAAVRENLAPLLPALGHALAKLQGDQADCGHG